MLKLLVDELFMNLQWDLFDNTMSNLLHKMITEDQVPLRKAYIKSLCSLISAMGPSVIRWSKPLAEIFDEYLHRESFDTRDDALMVSISAM